MNKERSTASIIIDLWLVLDACLNWSWQCKSRVRYKFEASHSIIQLKGSAWFAYKTPIVGWSTLVVAIDSLPLQRIEEDNHFGNTFDLLSSVIPSSSEDAESDHLHTQVHRHRHTHVNFSSIMHKMNDSLAWSLHYLASETTITTSLGNDDRITTATGIIQLAKKKRIESSKRFFFSMIKSNQ